MNETETSKYLTNPCLLKNETIKPKPVLLLMGTGGLREEGTETGEQMALGQGGVCCEGRRQGAESQGASWRRWHQLKIGGVFFLLLKRKKMLFFFTKVVFK